MLGPEFLETIGFQRIKGEERFKVIQQLVSILGARIGKVISETLNENEEMNELEQMLARNDDMLDIFDYVSETIPDFEKRVTLVVEEFKQELLDKLSERK